MLKRIHYVMKFFGLSPKVAIANLKNLSWFLHDYRQFKKLLKSSEGFPITDIKPILTDRTDDGGVLSGVYFHQDLLVAKRIFQNNPSKHVDIGSRTDGFVAHLASFREVELFDIRPIKSSIDNIKFIQADFTKVNENLRSYTDSISSLHAIEHFGLGRYNDKIDPDGHLKGLDTIYQTLRLNGKFYFSTPIGPQRIEFNAHRVFSLKYLLSILKDNYRLDMFSYIDDDGNLFEDIELQEEDILNNLKCEYGCGIFELTKIK